jgi:hypothetical protein
MNHADPQQDCLYSRSPRQQQRPSFASTNPTRGRIGRRRAPHRQPPIARPKPDIPIDLFIALMA